MATLMDQIMGRTDPRDFTLGSRATFQPYDQPFSRGGNLGNMGMRNMQRAQTALAATGRPPAAPEVPVDTMGTMYGFMPPAAAPAVPAVPAAPPPLPSPFQRSMAPRAQPLPTGPLSMAPLGGFTPMAPSVAAAPVARPAPAAAPSSPMNISPATLPAFPNTPEQQAADAAGWMGQSLRERFMQRLLGNPTQSNAMPVVMSPQGPMPSGAAMPQQINWGDAENPADFFRASQALQAMPGLLG